MLLHGFNSTEAGLAATQVPLFSARYRLLIPDWRGHGRTNNPACPPAMNHRRFARGRGPFCRALGERGRPSGATARARCSRSAWPSTRRAWSWPRRSAPAATPTRTRCAPWWRTITPETWVPPARRAESGRATRRWGRTMAERRQRLDRPRGARPHGGLPGAGGAPRDHGPPLILSGDRDRFFPAAAQVNGDCCLWRAGGPDRRAVNAVARGTATIARSIRDSAWHALQIPRSGAVDSTFSGS